MPRCVNKQELLLWSIAEYYTNPQPDTNDKNLLFDVEEASAFKSVFSLWNEGVVCLLDFSR